MEEELKSKLVVGCGHSDHFPGVFRSQPDPSGEVEGVSWKMMAGAGRENWDSRSGVCRCRYRCRCLWAGSRLVCAFPVARCRPAEVG